MLEGVEAENYIDDIITGGETIEENDRNVRSVLSQLQKYGFRVKMTKIQLGLAQVDYLGYRITARSFNMDAYRERVQKDLPAISSFKSLQKGLGVVNVMREFLPRFAHRMQKYYSILHDRSNPPKWERLDQEFQRDVANLLAKAVSLDRVERCSEFHLYTDWCKTGYGYTLYTKGRLINLGSRRIQAWKREVSSYLGELAALCWALKRTSWITRGATIKVFTDSDSALRNLHNIHSGPGETDGRVLRLLGYLSGNYSVGTNLLIEFVQGQTNPADVLSRWHEDELRPVRFTQTNEVELEVWHQGHMGAETMLRWAAAHGRRLDERKVKAYVQNCDVCQRFQRGRFDSELGTFPTSDRVGGLIGMDFIGPLPNDGSGLTHILVIIDHVSRFAVAKAVPTTSTHQVLAMLREWEKVAGYPDKILVDQGSGFTSQRFQQWCREHSVALFFTPAYSHKSAGLVERYNRSLLDRLRKLTYDAGQKIFEWRDHLKYASWLLQQVPHRGTGYAPQLLMTGVDMKGHKMSGQDWQGCIRQAIQTTQQRQEAVRKKRQGLKNIAEGDEVLLHVGRLEGKSRHKLRPFWEGPFTVLKRPSNHVVTLETLRGRSRIFNSHLDFVKVYHH